MLSCWVNAFRAQWKLEWAHAAARELLANRILLDWKAESEKTRHRYKRLSIAPASVHYHEQAIVLQAFGAHLRDSFHLFKIA